MHAPYTVREKRFTLNDNDRAQWLDSDDVLYTIWRRSRMNQTAFIRANRKLIDGHIRAILNH